MTFHINMINRDMPRKAFYEMWRRLRETGAAQDYRNETDWIEDRAVIKERLKRYTDSDGKIGIVECGRDCDMSEYCYSRIHQNLTVIKFIQMRDDKYAWADGPCCVYICPVEDLPGNHSRDLAMEAFEDGHPHIVSTVRFDEDGCY